MPSIAFEYRCRRCSKVERNPHTAEQNGLYVLVAVTKGRQSPLPGFDVPMVSIHTCPDKGMGVTDLTGYSIED